MSVINAAECQAHCVCVVPRQWFSRCPWIYKLPWGGWRATV